MEWFLMDQESWRLHKSIALKFLIPHHTMHKQMGKQSLPTDHQSQFKESC